MVAERGTKPRQNTNYLTANTPTDCGLAGQVYIYIYICDAQVYIGVETRERRGEHRDNGEANGIIISARRM